MLYTNKYSNKINTNALEILMIINISLFMLQILKFPTCSPALPTELQIYYWY